ncbi:Fic family protein [Subtercola sp. PAMC28395]|uniref:Fic family protein n=1 Tax=Subtercola sp. PAMC28395 TaxID=2846775 RepID=UPI001C0B4AA0|nr:Fic family protein [Subtercola sp. PAMC28395]QWT22812.1 Fic family protein [Subtercola sp. PAMC28395]
MTWPAHTSRVVPWQSQSRRGTREDRMLREITVSLPPLIAERSYVTPSSLVRETEDAVRDITTLDRETLGPIGALGSLLLRTESISSSKIEQIEASIDDYARAVAGIKANESATSMVAATTALSEMIHSAGSKRRIELDDILAAHKILMAEDPTDAPYAGTLRTVQNWIMGSDHSPRGAIHVPPPPETVSEYMTDLIAFANRDDVPAVAQAAIVHAQFESIHPFTDGNGRIGRALINAVFRRRGLTENTVIPIASAMVANRQQYFDLVNDYRTGTIDPFVRSLAAAMTVSARESRVSAGRLAVLPSEWQAAANPRVGSALTKILEGLAEHPILSAEDAIRFTGAPSSSIYAAMERLEAAGIIHQVTNRQRDKVWGATQVLDELDELTKRIAVEMNRAG